MSFTWIYLDGTPFSFVRSALLLAVVIHCVGLRYGSWVLLGLFCLLRVTHVYTATGSASLNVFVVHAVHMEWKHHHHAPRHA